MRTFLLVVPLLVGCIENEVVVPGIVDVFHQEPAERVDILLVVDNSCSMEPYQERLGQNFDAFISFFIGADVDYHIGVTTTTLEAPTEPYGACTRADYAEIPPVGRLVDATFITAETPNASDVFEGMVNVGTCGSGFEAGLEAARAALPETNGVIPNPGFIRDNAELSIIFVSDEQDYSPDPVNEYINDYLEIKGQRDRGVFNASALAVTDLDECQGSLGNGSTLGTRYVDVARQTAGIVGNLCSHDFEEVVTELSLNASRLQNTFVLSSDPQAWTIQVSVDQTTLPCDSGEWTYEQTADGPAVVFAHDAVPEPSSQIAIRYQPGDGDASTFCTEGP